VESADQAKVAHDSGGLGGISGTARCVYADLENKSLRSSRRRALLKTPPKKASENTALISIAKAVKVIPATPAPQP